LAPKSAKSSESPRSFKLVAGQGHPRSSILVSIESTLYTYPAKTIEVLSYRVVKIA